MIKILKHLLSIVTMRYHAKRNEERLEYTVFHCCVSKVKSRSGKKANPYAVCNATMSGKIKGKSKTRKSSNKN